MKKIICLILAIGMALSLAACNSAPIELTGTLEEIAAQIYAGTTTIEMALSDPEDIDLANVDDANYHLGVASTDSIERAIYSVPAINSIAYSMCLVKAKADADVEALKNEILEGVNYRKWICVAAEKIAVVNCGSTIMMVMSTEEIVDDVCNAFSAVAQAAGAEIAEPLTRAGEIQEEIPEGGIAHMDIPADMPAYDGETIGEEIPAEDGIVLA